MTEDTCGAETGNGEPCQNPATGENGRCWIPSHTDPGAENPQGRDPKLEKSRQENIASMIEDGHSIAAAARSNGITVQSFYNWMERGADQEEGIYAEFFERITRARGVGESKYLDAIVEIAKDVDDTATLMTLLKSRYPEAWDDANRGEQTGGGVVVNLGDADEFEIDEETLEVTDQ